MSSRLVKFTKILLDVSFYIGIIITIFIPVIFYYLGDYNTAFRHYYIIECILYMLSGLLCLFIVYELRNVFITILKGNAFVENNANALKKMSKYSFCISLLSIFRIPLSLTPATIVVIIVFGIAGLFSIVLCQLFETAIQFKNENDLTI